MSPCGMPAAHSASHARAAPSAQTPATATVSRPRPPRPRCSRIARPRTNERCGKRARAARAPSGSPTPSAAAPRTTHHAIPGPPPAPPAPPENAAARSRRRQAPKTSRTNRGTSATAICAAVGARAPARRRNMPIRTGIEACAWTLPATNAQALAPWTASRGTACPSTAWRDTRQASLRRTSVAAWAASSRPKTGAPIAVSACASSPDRDQQRMPSAASAEAVTIVDTTRCRRTHPRLARTSRHSVINP